MKSSCQMISNKVWIPIVIAAVDASGFKSITFVSVTAHAGGFKLQSPKQCLPSNKLRYATGRFRREQGTPDRFMIGR